MFAKNFYQRLGRNFENVRVPIVLAAVDNLLSKFFDGRKNFRQISAVKGVVHFIAQLFQCGVAFGGNVLVELILYREDDDAL